MPMPKSEGRLSHDEAGGFRQYHRKVVHALAVQRCGAANLAHADGHHLDQAAFDVASEAGVGLDSVDQHNAVRLNGIGVGVDRHAAVELSQNSGVHGGADGSPHTVLSQAVVFEYLPLALGVAGAVTAHGREQERFGTQRLDAVYHGLDNDLNIGDAAAAAADGDTLARLDPGGDFGLLELFGDGLWNIVHAGGPDLLPHWHHAGQGDIQTASDVYIDAIDHGLHSLVFEWGRSESAGESGRSIPWPSPPDAWGAAGRGGADRCVKFSVVAWKRLPYDGAFQSLISSARGGAPLRGGRL